MTPPWVVGSAGGSQDAGDGAREARDDGRPEARDGDGRHAGRAAFREVFTEQFGAMVALARLVGSDDPEDTAQEAFLRLHTRWDTLRDPAAAIGYLRSTVINLCRNRIRHLMVARRRGAQHDRPESGAEPSAESESVDRDRSRAVLAAVHALPKRQRAAIVLRYWMNLRYDEIAATLQCPAATTRSHVRRGLASLAHVLADEGTPGRAPGNMPLGRDETP